MHTINRPQRGLLALLLLGSLSSCGLSGSKPPVCSAQNTQVIPITQRQWVAIDPSLLGHPRLQPLPSPAVTDNGACKDGCYSNEQIKAALDEALNGYGQCTAQLDQIRNVSGKVVQSNP